MTNARFLLRPSDSDVQMLLYKLLGQFFQHHYLKYLHCVAALLYPELETTLAR